MNKILFRVGVSLMSAVLVSTAAAQQFFVNPVAEKRVSALPTGPLYWRIENFPTLETARVAAGPTALAVEVREKAWLFTLGPAGGSTAGGTKVAEIGPVPSMDAPQYLLRINHTGGPPGAKTPTHSHPGSEAFYVLTGQLGQATSQGMRRVDAGNSMNGQHADTPMEVSSSGSTDLNALVMFIVDATKPFSTHATIR